jgi:type III pantothenate kinase
VNAAALLLDIGNSRLKWALLSSAQDTARAAGTLIDAGALVLDPRRRVLPRDGAALARVLTHVCTHVSTHASTHGSAALPIVGCNVAGGAIERQIGAAARRAGLPAPRWVRSVASAEGVRNAYREPRRLGADRWVALIGARAAHPRRVLCIVSVGTAVTIDLLDARGRHRGGLITPGPSLMIDALLARTAGIRRRAGGAPVAMDLGADPDLFWARDTRNALRAGARQATAALIAQARHAARALLQSAPRLLVTGGGAAAIAALLPAAVRYEPDLVLHGLGVIARAGAARDALDRRRRAVRIESPGAARIPDAVCP